MKPPFKIRYQLITPQIAADWLREHNTSNRKLRDSAVRSLAGDMAAGEWIQNHQGIAFGESGRLLDGQHRLAAIVRSGASIPFLVFDQVPEKPPGKSQTTMDTIDRGAPRSIGDLLKLQHGIEKYETFVAALSTSLFDISLTSVKIRKCKMTLRGTLAILEITAEPIRWLCENRPTMRGFNSSAVLAPFAYAHHENPTLAHQALTAFATGAGLQAGDPILTLRNYILSRQGLAGGNGIRSTSDRLKISAVVLACLHSHLTAAPLDKLEPRRVTRYAVELLNTWPELRDRAKALLTEAAPPPMPKLTPYAESLVRAVEISESIHRRISKKG
jgi:hypothetical protein